jgi:hypothetical protein
MTGRLVPAGGQSPGRKYVVENLDLRVRHRYRPGQYSTRQVQPTVLRTELAWFARDDVMPLVAMTARSVGRLVRYLMRRARMLRSARRSARS